MDEEWKYIEGYQGLYQVSSFGRVKSFAKRKNGYILKLIDNKLGYLRVSLWNKEGKEKRWRVNRLVALMFIPNPDNYPEVNHIDGDTKNNHVSNLEWCSRSQNAKHSFKLNPNQRAGEKSKANKLTSQEVIEIYKLAHETKMSGKEIGTKYGVSNITVSAIKTGRNWNHLTHHNEIKA